MLDATSGELVDFIKAVLGCVPGSEGLFADSAKSNGVVFVNGQDCSIFANPPHIPPTGVVIALKSEIEWKNCGGLQVHTPQFLAG